MQQTRLMPYVLAHSVTKIIIVINVIINYN